MPILPPGQDPTQIPQPIDPMAMPQLPQMPQMPDVVMAPPQVPVPPPAPASAAPVPEDPRLTEALQQQSKQRMMSDLLRGFQQALQGSASGSGFKADFTMADQMNQRADEPVTRYKEKVASEAAAKKEGRDVEAHKAQMSDFQMKLAKANVDFTDMKANRDPLSPNSRIAQDRAIEILTTKGQPFNEAQIRAQSGENLYKILPDLQKDLQQFYENQRQDKSLAGAKDVANINRRSAEKIASEANKTKLDAAQISADSKAKVAEAKAKTAPNEGQKAVDKKYATDYNEFTSKGQVNVKNSIAKLESLAAEMEKDQGFGEAGGGRVASILPDVARSRDAIRRRDSARNEANRTLKALFPGALSDAEREAAAKEFYNDALDNKENAKILRQKVADLNSGLAQELTKAKYFEKNGTLKGFVGSNLETSDGDYVMLESPTGEQAKVKKSEMQKYLDKGAKVVEQ